MSKQNIIVERHSYNLPDAQDTGAEIEPNTDGAIVNIVPVKGRNVVEVYITPLQPVDFDEGTEDAPWDAESVSETVEGEDDSTPINDTSIHARAVGALSDAGYETVSDLRQTDEDISEIKGIGPSTMDTINEVIEE